MDDPKGTIYASVISGITMKGQRDDPQKLSVYITFPDGTERKMFDTTDLKDMMWMGKVQQATGLQRLYFCWPSKHIKCIMWSMHVNTLAKRLGFKQHKNTLA